MKVIVNGINGAMGKFVASMVREKESLTLLGGVDPFADADAFVKTTLEDCEVPDLIIDFSHHSLIDHLIDYSVENNVKLVIATTGLSDSTVEKMKEASRVIPIFYSANYSYGVTVLNKILALATEMLEQDFDIELMEKHHTFKIDSPSGTAKMLLDTIIDNSTVERRINNGRKGVTEKKSIHDIGVHAIRGGTIVGEHTIQFAGHDEIIELKHTAMSKAIFAKGAVKAGLFLENKTPGLYTMKDLI